MDLPAPSPVVPLASHSAPWPSRWPSPADPAAAERLLERFAEIGAAEAKLVQRPDVAAMLRALGGNSPFLSDLAVRESATVRRLFREGPDAVVASALRSITHSPANLDKATLAATLRQAKRRLGLASAIADIGGVWPLERVTGALSTLAEVALDASVAFCLRAAQARGGLTLPPGRRTLAECGFTVLGMGKLGARELNYSSDIDLVLIYDPERHPHHTDGLGAVFTRLARDMCTLMEARDADGYVFRTDLRLRPDPGATPPAIALPNALAYYESMGENWERAAMIKARPVAGDRALGEHFLREIRPFVWRRHLDFAAVNDIRAMKRRMDDHHLTGLGDAADPVERLAGHDVKLGQGGIRGVEFAVQTMQLVWGGRNPALRVPTTTGALEAMVQAGHLERSAATVLLSAYRFLRTVEHRLQMVADRQTHSLPADVPGMERFAHFMGYETGLAFAEALLGQMEQVRLQDAALFDSPDRGAPATLTTDALTAMGFTEPERVLTAVRSWQSGSKRAFRSERARTLLEAVLPGLLRALAAQRQPDAALARLDTLLGQLPGGVHLLSLLQRRPVLMERIAAVLGAAPSLADHLAQVPAALEGLLAPEEGPADPVAMLHAQLADARALDDAVAIVRRTVRGEEFRLAVAQMEGRLDADAAGLRRTALADAALTVLLPRVLAAHEERFGRVPGGALAVVVLGKAGGQEMMAGSDLDLMLMYDHAPDAAESDGPRRLPPSQYYIRAAHAVVAALTAPGVDGALYAVDMRLRPSGNKGPVAVSLAAFRHYHVTDAWTWERMALTRARVVAGAPDLCRALATAIAEAVASADPATVRSDAAAMRIRMLRDLPAHGPWDVKLMPGGQIEVEFIVQTALLLTAEARPAPTIRVAIDRLGAAGAFDRMETATLREADHLWRTVQGLLRITVGPRPPEALPESAAEVLQAATGDVDADAFRARLEATGARVRAVFNARVGAIG
ncbi:bifunctional [glutamine synthetase] adenylyltransferase/[glutamine synthetase]-adenylyl-L-tyrosine phosphorylase [Acidisphaera sp. L21]|uniref:bifunctional [glutamine synthetase] adenylyltransferase/[glutamine synthetase]-adenylyl-L-tyrosine phosphorylase n=1 Tax=Acidisphaera sp. L21 TaxID=1641851 RepID=UPI00131B7061|nr:bifunctional [glutamine synthetase] adenylyltransferase/[glutamine synthetase]-adenylyl-L-tyrosine phosphorylase [Acidisphaera sp. L21]